MKKSGVDKSQWTVDDKSKLHNALLALQEKDCSLFTTKLKIEQKEKLSKIRDLRKKIKEDRATLNSIKKEDMQRLKLMLQRHNVNNILNQEHTFETVLGKMDYKIFTETNELNRLIREEENLSQIYESKLIDLSKVQDRVVHLDQYQLYDEIQANKLRLQLKNHETRLRARRTINQLCRKIINSLAKDFHCFDQALSALKTDIKEQDSLLDAIIKLEIPANEDHQDLFSDCKKLKKNVDKSMKIRLASLNEFTTQIITNTEAVKRLVMSEDDVKSKSKPSEKVTFSSEDTRITQSNEMVASNSKKTSNANVDEEDAESEHELSREALAKLEAEEALQLLQFNLELETAKEEQLESELRFAEKVLIKIQSTFKHFTEVLQQIGEDYDDQVDVEAYGETEILVRIVLHRCNVLTAILNEKVMKKEIPTCKMILDTNDISDYSEHNKFSKANKDPDIMDDPSVPTRDRIKAVSAKLVEMHLTDE